MVLPVRIELTTSALPRMRSTTELRQHWPATTWPLAEGALETSRDGLSRRCRHAIANNMESKAERDARLGAALRANLKRRKEQARGQAAVPADQPTPPQPKNA